MTNGNTGTIIGNKKRGFCFRMREKIIRESLESIRREGLRFSVDTLAEKLRVSKKTIYRYFPDKEALATAWYEILIKFFECFAGVMIGREILFQKIASSGKQMKSSLLSLQNLRLSGQAKSERRRVPPAKLSLAQTKSVCTCGAQSAALCARLRHVWVRNQVFLRNLSFQNFAKRNTVATGISLNSLAGHISLL